MHEITFSTIDKPKLLSQVGEYIVSSISFMSALIMKTCDSLLLNRVMFMILSKHVRGFLLVKCTFNKDLLDTVM